MRRIEIREYATLATAEVFERTLMATATCTPHGLCLCNDVQESRELMNRIITVVVVAILEDINFRTGAAVPKASTTSSPGLPARLYVLAFYM